MKAALRWLAAACVVGFPGVVSAAQPGRGFEAGLLVSWLSFGEFDADDVGAGVRVGYRLRERFALEAELEHAPSTLGEPGFSASRTSGAMRARAGIGGQRWSLFASLAPGFARFSPAPEPIACIAVFPAPLECQLAAGQTVLALGYGASLELSPTERWLLRLDVEERLLHYPVAFRRDGRWEHHLRVAVALGLRF